MAYLTCPVDGDACGRRVGGIRDVFRRRTGLNNSRPFTRGLEFASYSHRRTRPGSTGRSFLFLIQIQNLIFGAFAIACALFRSEKNPKIRNPERARALNRLVSPVSNAILAPCHCYVALSKVWGGQPAIPGLRRPQTVRSDKRYAFSPTPVTAPPNPAVP